MTPLIYTMIVAVAVAACLGFYIGKLNTLQSRVAMLEAMLHLTVRRQGMHEAAITKSTGTVFPSYPVDHAEKSELS